MTHDDCHQYTLFHFSFLLFFSHTSFRFLFFIPFFYFIHSFFDLLFLLFYRICPTTFRAQFTLLLLFICFWLSHLSVLFVLIRHSVRLVICTIFLYRSTTFYVLTFFSQNFLPGRSFILSYSMWCSEIFHIMQSASLFRLLSFYFQTLSSFSTLLLILIISFLSHTLPSFSSHHPYSCPFLDLHYNILSTLLYYPSPTTPSLITPALSSLYHTSRMTAN